MRLKDISILDPSPRSKHLNGDVSFIPMESLCDGYIANPELISYEDGKAGYTYFADGDLLIAKVTPCFENGNIAIAKNLVQHVGFGSSEIFVLRMNKKALNTYIFYLAQTSQFRSAAYRTMCGAGGLKRVPSDFMKTYELELPDLPTQHRIVSFLDKKTAIIDRKIEILQKQLDAYTRLKASIILHAVTRGLNSQVRLKDSGVDWLGQIPACWTICRTKDVVDIQTVRTHDLSTHYIALENICSWDATFVESNAETEGTNSVFNRGDILWGKLRPYLAKGYIPQYSGICSTEFFVLRAKKFSLNRYLLYLFLSHGFISSINSKTCGVKMPRTNWQNFAAMRIPLPKLYEQKRIVMFCDFQCKKIKKAKENIAFQIGALQRLKRALINETVSGQQAV